MTFSEPSKISNALSGASVVWLLTPLLIAVPPILEALGAQSIPMFSDGFVRLVGIAAAVCLTLGAAGAFIDSRLTGPSQLWFRVFCLAVGLLVLADLGGASRALGGTSLAATIGKTIAYAAAAALATAFAFFLIRLGKPALLALTVFLAVMFVATVGKHWSTWIPRLNTPTITSSLQKPAIIHIILDEMIGLAGMPKDIPGGPALAQQMADVLSRHGFTIYPRAFSRHFMTAVSIPNLLNYDFRDATYGTVSRYQSKTNFRVNQENLHFDTLRKQGYALSVFQTIFFDFCKVGPVQSCITFPSYDPWNIYLKTPTADAQRKAARTLRLASQSSWLLSSYFGMFEGPVKGEFIANPVRFDLHGLAAWVDHIGNVIVANKRGIAHFVHILAPHGPYILDKQCQVVRPWAILPQFMREDRGLTEDAYVLERRQQYQRYFEQSGCVFGLLDQLLGKIAAAPDLKDATIIIQGDHGSRLSAGRFKESVKRIDMIDNYSTLFAIKEPAKPASTNDREVSVQQLFAEHFQPAAAAAAPAPTVSVERKTPGQIEATPMPQF